MKEEIKIDEAATLDGMSETFKDFANSLCGQHAGHGIAPGPGRYYIVDHRGARRGEILFSDGVPPGLRFATIAGKIVRCQP